VDIRGFGLRARLPDGWEGALRRAPASSGELGAAGDTAAAPTAPVLHLSTAPLPADRGDFGSGAVELLADDDAFVALVEYDREEVGSALFAEQGLPRRLDPRRFHPRSLQRQLPGQAGWQHFFTEAGRPFCLYVVLGDQDDAFRQTRRVEQVLAAIHIEPAP
jgi:hypothetical protein